MSATVLLADLFPGTMLFPSLLPLLFAHGGFSAPPIIITILLIVIAVLVIRFLLKATLTLVKIAILVVIGVVVWFALQRLFG